MISKDAVSSLTKRNEANTREENQWKVQLNNMFRKATALCETATYRYGGRTYIQTSTSGSDNSELGFSNSRLNTHTDCEEESPLPKKKFSFIDEQRYALPATKLSTNLYIGVASSILKSEDSNSNLSDTLV